MRDIPPECLAEYSAGKTDEVAAMVKTFTGARCEYGLVSDLLDLCEEIFHGEAISDADRFTLFVAATAAPFVRQERKERNIDAAGA